MNTLKLISVLFGLFVGYTAMSQTNCNLFEAESDCRIACLETEKAMNLYSGSEAFQQSLLRAIDLCPTFHYAYFELSVNYAKRGLITEWTKLINKAVALSPEDHLGWRGWYHWFFMKNYEKAIADIDRLDDLVPYDIGTTGDGLYHLNILKALCYKGLGNREKAITLIEENISSVEYTQGAYDYLHLGVLYLETNQLVKALEAFEVQKAYNEVSEVHYYIAKAHELMGNIDRAQIHLELALATYDAEKTMSDPYIELPDEIYRQDILEQIDALRD